MPLVPKIDPNKIFASNAPTQDKPAAFDNYEKGMDETRKNLGRPTIPQLNYLHQTADQKILWIHQNGAGLPYDPLIEYAEKSVTLKDGELKQLVDGAWVETKTKALPATAITTSSSQNQQEINDFGGAKWYAKVGGYELGATVKLDNVDTVKSTIPNNTNNPNVDMTGWFLIGSNTITTAESIADLIDIQNPREGQVVEVKSYYAGDRKGGGLFVFKSGIVGDNKTSVIGGIGGSWYRAGWDSATTATIYQAGIKADGSNETDRFDNLIAAAKGKHLYLMGKTVKTNGFRIGSGTAILNGGLDFSSSTIIQEGYRFFDGYIIGDNRPRNYNAEYDPNYAALDPIYNIKIDSVDFILPKNPISAFRAVFFHKIHGLTFTRNKLLESNGHTWIQVVGGHDGSDLESLQPDDYVDLVIKNGRNSDIKIMHNKMHGTQAKLASGHYISHRLCHIVSSENIKVKNNYARDVTCNISIDGYNRNAVVENNRHEVSDALYNMYPEFDSADTISYYVGQGSYDITLRDNFGHNYGHSGIYTEAAKSCKIYNNRMTVNKDLIPRQSWSVAGIRIQSNHYAMGGSNLSSYGSALNYQVYGNYIESLQNGIVTDGIYADSHKDITISNNRIKSFLSLQSIHLHNSIECTVNNNNTNGSLGLGAVSDCMINNNKFANGRNFALYLHDSLIENNEFNGNKFLCGQGAVIYNNSKLGSNIKLMNGSIIGTTHLLQSTGDGLLQAYDFLNGIPSLYVSFTQTLTITPGSSKLFEVPCDGVKKGWFVNVKTDEMENFYNNVQVDFNINAVCENDKIIVLVKNIGSGTNNATVYFSAMLSSYLNKQYLN